MQHFKLPAIEGTKSSASDIIYFSCNKDYYYKYGKALIRSIVDTVSFVSVHCHLILKLSDLDNIDLLETLQVTYTYEIITDEFLSNIPINYNRLEGKDIWNTDSINEVIEKTYYASARFMRLPELFNDKQYVFQIDCDSLLRNKFSQNDFRNLTKDVRVMPKPKDPSVIIASSICLGLGNASTEFKNKFSSKLKAAFATGAYWYIDQDILKETINEVEWKSIPFLWNSWKISTYDFFVTGKGSRKEKEKFTTLLDKWST